jgi:glycosyltransferase involved in cell wall biosynthesis
MRIAIIDQRVIRNNPIGGCHRRMLEGLCGEHEFTVFAPQFDNPNPDRIKWVRIWCPMRPDALMFISLQLMVPVYYWAYRLWHRMKFEAVQVVESKTSFGDISYAHFCHRAYLRKRQDATTKGLRGWLRWFDHYMHMKLEPVVYRRTKKLVVPSSGLAGELTAEYPFVAGKVHVVPNPVDIERMKRPADFNRDEFRQTLGIGERDVALVFSALGHFERKGMPLLLEAMSELKNPLVKLIVVGGRDDTVNHFREMVAGLGLENQVIFVGMQKDVAPYLWAGDGFALPSHYETFSLVAFEAAAAGLPVIVSSFYGLGEIIKDGVNGIVTETNTASVLAALKRLLVMSPEQRVEMGRLASNQVANFDTAHFLAAWRNFYGEIYPKSPKVKVPSESPSPMQSSATPA